MLFRSKTTKASARWQVFFVDADSGDFTTPAVPAGAGFENPFVGSLVKADDPAAGREVDMAHIAVTLSGATDATQFVRSSGDANGSSLDQILNRVSGFGGWIHGIKVD